MTNVDPWGLNNQFSIGGGGTIGLPFIGIGGGFNFGVSIPDDLSDWGCYQFFASPQINLMTGLGLYMGLGATAGWSDSQGPLPIFSGGIPYYGEFDVGPVSVGGQYDNGSTGVGLGLPIPHVGAGIGGWAGGGFALTGSIATPTFGGNCGCH